MRNQTLILLVAILAIASSCSKEKKIAKLLWTGEGTWTVSASSFAYYSMGTYNTATSTYDDSLTTSSGSFNGSTYTFEKYDNVNLEGRGTYTTVDTSINFSYSVYEKSNFGGAKGEFELTITNDPPTGGTSMQEIYDIVSYDDTKMSLEKVDNTAWSTTPYSVTHSYITITMDKQ